MTATVTEAGLEEQVISQEESAEQCEGLTYERYDCPNEPVYRMECSCCKMRFCWCESCLFEWFEYARDYEGFLAECNYCFLKVFIDPHHVRVIGRVR